MKDWWMSTGKWGWFCTLLVSVALIIALFYNQLAVISLGWQKHGTQMIGNTNVTISTRGPMKPGALFELRIESEHSLTGFVGIPPLMVPIDSNLELVAPQDTQAVEIVMVVDGAQGRWPLGKFIGARGDSL
ncbi:MAG: hypothetical protein JJ957_12225 [Pseudomonadales bacterium]|nr:hypothetical protein [Pseudomonadales bacterium]MBO6563128.1 hypothetical protein [Pseudomonadales bacterium]MBO6596924.1 hypothetical protein [Pseudomonadales bacterium]MBO6823087.1 hypothetical protein [Pseudomonadales bacterium]